MERVDADDMPERMHSTLFWKKLVTCDELRSGVWCDGGENGRVGPNRKKKIRSAPDKAEEATGRTGKGGGGHSKGSQKSIECDRKVNLTLDFLFSVVRQAEVGGGPNMARVMLLLCLDRFDMRERERISTRPRRRVS